MQKSLLLDIPRTKTLEMLNDYAPENDWQGLKQSFNQLYKVQFPENRSKRVRMTETPNFVVEYEFGMFAIKGDISGKNGKSIVKMQLERAIVVDIVKWAPAFVLLLIAMPLYDILKSASVWELFLSLLCICVFFGIWYGFYYIINMSGQRAWEELHDYILTVFEGHVIREKAIEDD